MQVRCEQIKLKEGSLRKIKEWADHLNDSKDDLLDIFRDKSIKIESFFLNREKEGDYLILYYRADNIEEALNSIKMNPHPLDEYTRKMLLDVAESRTELEVLLDLAKV